MSNCYLLYHDTDIQSGVNNFPILVKEVLSIWPQYRQVNGKPCHSQSQDYVERSNRMLKAFSLVSKKITRPKIIQKVTLRLMEEETSISLRLHFFTNVISELSSLIMLYICLPFTI